MNTLSLPAPAKINRFLHIVGRRPDGYHLLQTLFHLIDFSDQLHFTLRKDSKITVHVKHAKISAQQNLAFHAAKLLQQSDKKRQGVDIVIEKKIPIGGGLGGGSSDAATTLHALNLLWKLQLSVEQLCELGLRLGADVPVFVVGETAWAEGIGEKLTPLHLPDTWFLVINSPTPVNTAEIFCDQQLTKDTPICKISPALADTGKNDCESVVRRRYPAIDEAISWLNQFAHARLTGTGGCVFASFSNVAAALTVIEQLPQQFSGFIAKGIVKSPLLNSLKHYTIAPAD